MKYIVQSTAVIDSIYLPGCERPMIAMGGAGFYALCGMKVWEDDITIVTGTGMDYLEEFNSWYRVNNISTEGLLVKDPQVPRTIVEYSSDGERVETPYYGSDHYQKTEATPTEIEPFLKGAGGVYIFKNTAPAYWNKMLEYKEELGFVLMWEVAADATVPEQRDAVRAIAEKTDVFSLNRTEALTMLDTDDISSAAKILATWDIPLVYLRLGRNGVLLLRGEENLFVPSVPELKVVDHTGGGNSSSGAALVGYCRGYSLGEIGAMGNVSASFCIGQWGAPNRFDEALRIEANRRKELVLSTL